MFWATLHRYIKNNPTHMAFPRIIKKSRGRIHDIFHRRVLPWILDRGYVWFSHVLGLQNWHANISVEYSRAKYLATDTKKLETNYTRDRAYGKNNILEGWGGGTNETDPWYSSTILPNSPWSLTPCESLDLGAIPSGRTFNEILNGYGSRGLKSSNLYTPLKYGGR